MLGLPSRFPAILSLGKLEYQQDRKASVIAMGESQVILFDWGDTVMRAFPDETGPMEGWRRVEAMPGIQDVLALPMGSAQIVLATNAADSSRRR